MNKPEVYAKEEVVVQEREKTVQELIISYSEKYGVDPRLTLAIAKAESRFKNVENYMYDGENGMYSAYGIFQTTRTFWWDNCSPNKDDRFDIEKNIECSVRVISQGGESHWNESKAEWSKTRNKPIEWFLTEEKL